MRNAFYYIILFCIISANSFAKSDIKFLEGQLSFEGKKRSGKLTIFNQGDQPATAEIIFKKQIVLPDGRKTFEDMSFDYTAYPYNVDITKFLKISPRRITLEPKRKQTFRVFLRKPPTLGDGEYRVFAFLEVKELASEPDDLAASQDSLALDIRVGVSLGIPIVIYHGELTSQIEDIVSAEITPLPSEQIGEGRTHSVKTVLKRSGNASFGGYIHIVYENNRGEVKKLFYQAVTVVPDNDIFTFIYEFDPGIDIDNLPPGSLKIQLYDRSQENLLLEKAVN